MICHNFECPEGHVTEKMVNINEENWTTQICDQDACPCIAERVFLSKRMQALHRLPITIYRNSAGEVRFPGAAREAMPDNYKSQGFQRVEMTYHEAKKFEKEFNLQERSRSGIKNEFMDMMEGEQQAENRSELLHAMRTMTPRGREYAEYAIEQANKARKYESEDPGFHIEILH